jgi:hypothetical protein
MPTNVDKDRVLTVTINAESKFVINDTTISNTQLAEKLIRFIREKGKEHIIEIKANQNADYESYFILQNIIVNTYRDVRNTEAWRLFKKEITKCTEEQKEQIRQAIPQHISEEFI